MNTTWYEIGDNSETIECPDAIRFEAASYVYFNDCYAADLDGVVETGIYRVSDGKLTLRNRRIGSTGPRVGGDSDPLEIRIISATGSDLMLGVDDVSISFHCASALCRTRGRAAPEPRR